MQLLTENFNLLQSVVFYRSKLLPNIAMACFAVLLFFTLCLTPYGTGEDCAGLLLGIDATQNVSSSLDVVRK